MVPLVLAPVCHVCSCAVVQNSTLPDLDVGTDLNTLWLQEDLTDVLEGGVWGVVWRMCMADCAHMQGSGSLR